MSTLTIPDTLGLMIVEDTFSISSLNYVKKGLRVLRCVQEVKCGLCFNKVAFIACCKPVLFLVYVCILCMCDGFLPYLIRQQLLSWL